MTTLLRPDEVAKVLNTTDRHVRELCARGELRAGKTGRIWRIHPEDLDAYLRSLRGLAQPAAVLSKRGVG